MNNQFTPGPWEKRRCDDETIAIIGNTQQQESGCAYRIAHIYETKEADYTKPLEITWLCASCHRKKHN